MHTPAPTTRLQPQQTRLIHASEGMRLRVVCGRLWLTQPNVAQDLFLGPGDCIDLKQDWVVVGADAEPGQGLSSPSNYSAYVLQPLVARQPAPALLRRFMTASSWLKAQAARAFKVAPRRSAP